MTRPRTRKTQTPSTFASGFVSILGLPNAGKSTLLNLLVGQKLAAVADKPQTTRTTVQGVWTTDSAQVVFVDTPGIHKSDTLLNQRMMQSIREALDDRDLLLYVADSNRLPGEPDEMAVSLLRKTGTPALLVLNKIDRLSHKDAMLPLLHRYQEIYSFEEFFPISALTGDGVEPLRAAILSRMPQGPKYYPDDYVTDQPERFLAAEIVREKILLATREEVPHHTTVLIDDWKQEGRLLRIMATIYVERPGQKGIIVGAHGSKLKEIGTKARIELESMLGHKIFLQLHVKVQPGWRESPAFLRGLDWRAMIGTDAPAAPVKTDNENE
jgi:GTP-binding protein Era